MILRTDDELPGLFDLSDVYFDAFESVGSFQRKLFRFLTRGKKYSGFPPSSFFQVSLWISKNSKL
jgi:hypothetical protein